MQDPQSLHKYLYVHGDPVQGVDPSGLFTQAFGYAVEPVIQEYYAQAHILDDYQFGTWARFPGPAYRAKPDILNHTKPNIFGGTGTFNEIKPLSPSGILAGAAQMILREFQFGPLGYQPDPLWPIGVGTGYALGVPFIYFNLGGVIFYTDLIDLAEDYAAARSLGFQGAWKLLTKGNASRLLEPAIARVRTFALAGNRGDHVRLNDHVGIGGLLCALGFV